MSRQLHIKVDYCGECPAFDEDYDNFGTCRVNHIWITPSDHLDNKGHLGFPKDCPLQEVKGNE